MTSLVASYVYKILRVSIIISPMKKVICVITYMCPRQSCEDEC